MSAHLSEPELDSLTECECGHFLNEHSSEGCLATNEDGLDGICICMFGPDIIRVRAFEAILAARVAAAVAAEREAVWNEAAELADAVIVSWSGVAGLHPTEPEPHPAAIAAAGARRTLVVLRSRVSEAFEERRALIAEARS